MASLVTVANVTDRLFGATGITQPSGLTSSIVTSYVEGATARILRAANRSTVPTETEELNEMKELCLDMVGTAIRKDFFGLDAEASLALAKEHEFSLKRIEAAARNRAPNVGVQAKVVGGKRT